MKRTLQRVWVILLLFSGVESVYALSGRSFFTYRSQSTNAARDMVGWRAYYDNQACPTHPNYGTLSLTAAINKSFDGRSLANYFFGTDALHVSGSRVPMRGSDDILADYFGLPTDYEGMICFCPSYESALFDFSWYLGLDNWHEGMYFAVHMPLVAVQTSMGFHDSTCAAGELNYPAGYMSSRLIERREMASTIASAWQSDMVIGDIQPLKYGLLGCPKREVGFSELQAVFGINVVDREHCYFGLNIRGSIPTGTLPRARYIFESIIGNGKHWELGAGLDGGVRLWENCAADRSWWLYGELNLMHLFPSHQRRSYDLYNNGTLSRYMLLEVMGNPTVQGLKLKESPDAMGTDFVPAVKQYAGVLCPAINKTTLMSSISIGVQVDGVLMLAYRHKAINFNIGYNLWGRMGETLACREQLPTGAYAVKGDAQVYGFDTTTTLFVALNATQSQATISAGQSSSGEPKNAATTFVNLTADNADTELGKAQFRGVNLNQSYDGGIENTGLVPADIAQVRGSEQAVLLTDDDIDNVSALAPSALSQKIFVHLDYAWHEHCGVIPYFGGGAEYELDGGTAKKIDALSQWGIWLKGGIAF